MATLQDLENSISTLEGYGPGSAIPTQANNPGDLEIGDIGYGTIGAAGGNQITVFPSPTAGQQALTNQLNRIGAGNSSVYSPDESISEFGQTYSGGNPTYGPSLASMLGVPASTPIGSVIGNSQGASPGVVAGQAATTATNPFSKALSSVSGILSGTSIGSGILAQIESYLGTEFSAQRWVTIGLGLIFIGGAVFSLKSTQTIIQTGARVAGDAARAASAA
jgi:hypothetical protein